MENKRSRKLEVYMRAVAGIRTRMKRLDALYGEGYGEVMPDDINWQDVVNALEVLQHLEDAVVASGQKAE